MINSQLLPKPNRFFFTVLVFLLFTSFSLAEIDVHVPMGWAAVPSSVGRPGIDGQDVESTIGGGNGRLVEASGGEVGKLAGSSEPLVILASGSCGGFNVASNKTIIGVGSGLTVSGGVGIDGVSNVIIRNVKISGGTDAMSLSKTHHVWVDHCDLSRASDGLCDMKRGADKITISWTKFSQHNKNMLINHGKNIEDDKGRLNVTIHHNWFEKTVQRNPRAGFGQIQILNNYYNANGSYSIHVYWNAEVVIERNYFNNVNDAISDHYRGQSQGDWPGPGYVVLIDNYTNVPGSIMKETTTDPDRIFNIDDFYMYDWVVTKDVQQVPELVQSKAGPGPEWGKVSPIPTPGQGYTRVSTSPTLKWTKVGSKESNKVYFGTTNPPPEAKTVSGYSYQPGGLKGGTVYYWKINDGNVWKFRTSGTPVAVRPNSASSRGEAASGPAFKRGKPGQPTILMGVQKKADEERFYDLKGRNHTQAKGQTNNITKKAGQ